MDSHEKRIEKLEFVVAHLQQNLDQLNEVLVQFGKQINALEKRSHDLRAAQQILHQKLDSDGNLPFEKPPHY